MCKAVHDNSWKGERIEEDSKREREREREREEQQASFVLQVFSLKLKVKNGGKIKRIG